MEKVQHTRVQKEKNTTWKIVTFKDCNMKRMQHEKVQNE